MTNETFEQKYEREYREQYEKQKLEHQEAFKGFLAKNPQIKLIDEAEGLKVGDKVTFTNDFGVVFPGHTILAIDADNSFYGRQFYLDYDCYWFPAHPKNLTKEV